MASGDSGDSPSKAAIAAMGRGRGVLGAATVKYCWIIYL